MAFALSAAAAVAVAAAAAVAVNFVVASAATIPRASDFAVGAGMTC